MRIDTIKCHGSGNDFILIDELTDPVVASDVERSLLARILCNRGIGIGADGILFVRPSITADGMMYIVNADGTVPETCGNGLRCTARYLMDKQGTSSCVLETPGGRSVCHTARNIAPRVATTSVTIGPILPIPIPGQARDLEDLEPVPLPSLDPDYRFVALSAPNPHLIGFVESFDQERLARLGQKANADKELFPEGMNVSLVRKLSADAIYVRTYERGVGLTQSCGSASCASACALVLADRSLSRPRDIAVYSGTCMIACRPQQSETTGELEVLLTGNGTFEHHLGVEVSEPLAIGSAVRIADSEAFTRETEAFLTFEKECREVMAAHGVDG